MGSERGRDREGSLELELDGRGITKLGIFGDFTNVRFDDVRSVDRKGRFLILIEHFSFHESFASMQPLSIHH
jgi:hypothetical protein